MLAATRSSTVGPRALIIVVRHRCAVAVAGSTWYLTGDFSHTEFLVRAIPRHPPLIGVAARVQDLGSTPGPSMAYLLYPFYKLFGSTAFALVAAVDLLHLAAIAGAVVVAKRVGGTSIAVLDGAEPHRHDAGCRAAVLSRTVERVGAGLRLRPVPGTGVGTRLRAPCAAAARRRRRQPLRADPHQLHGARHRIAGAARSPGWAGCGGAPTGSPTVIRCDGC